ncbi:Kv channel-interacting protein 1 [Aphelenchoides bicaudatus]|nr:Kv channel-interacting protein 1 [Aphelenchoides bicaudatus]
MFINRNSFVEPRNFPQRRRTQVNVHKCFDGPPALFNNPIASELFTRLYWIYRSAQYRLFYKDEEADANSLSELIKFEPTERPPNLAELTEITQHRFSTKYMKYMYAQFKQECPSGRMKLPEFKRLFAAYIPNRVSDDYFERMFNAFLHDSDYLTFKDLIVCLSLLQGATPRENAEFTVRLISGKETDRVHFDEFKDFVQSVYLLTGGNPMMRRTDSALLLSKPPVDDRSQIDANRRATTIFKELDSAELRGYITLEDLEELFRTKETKAF